MRVRGVYYFRDSMLMSCSNKRTAIIAAQNDTQPMKYTHDNDFALLPLMWAYYNLMKT